MPLTAPVLFVLLNWVLEIKLETSCLLNNDFTDEDISLSLHMDSLRWHFVSKHCGCSRIWELLLQRFPPIALWFCFLDIDFKVKQALAFLFSVPTMNCYAVSQ